MSTSTRQFELPLQWEFHFDSTEHDDAETVFDAGEWQKMPVVAAPSAERAEIRRGIGGIRWEYAGQGRKSKYGVIIAHWIHARRVSSTTHG